MATQQDIAGLYGLLGRAPDQAGLDWWTQQANNGMSMDAIRQSFQNVANAGTDPLKPAAQPQGLLAPTQSPPQASQLPPAGNHPLNSLQNFGQGPRPPSNAPVTGGGPTGFGNVPYLRSDGTYDPGQEWRVMAGGQANSSTQGLLAPQTPQPAAQQQGLPSLPEPAYKGQTLQQMKDFMQGLAAKGVDIYAPDFYKNPEWDAYIQEDTRQLKPVLDAQQKQYAEEGYVGPVGWGKTPTDVLSQQIAANPAIAEGWRQYLPPEAIAGNKPTIPAAPGMGGNNPPPGPLPWQAPQGLLAPQPPVPGQYNQGMTGAPAGSFPRPAPNYWNGNDFVIPHFQTPASRPTSPLLPTGISDGNASTTTAGNAPQSTGSTGGIIAGAALPAIAGLTGDALINGLAANPISGPVIRALGITSGAMDGLVMGADGRLSRAPSPPGALPGTGFVSPQSQTFMQNFNSALQPGWMNTIGAGLAAVPDLLQGDYAQAAGAGVGTYVGAAAGTAAGAGVGGILGNFIIPGVGGFAGGLLGKELAKVFGPGKSVGPNAGANLAVNNGMAQFQSSGADNKGNTQYVDQFINAVAMGANEAATNNGVKLSDGGYRIAVEVIGGKLNVVGADGVKRSFEPDQGKEAYQYAVESLLKSGKA